MIRRLVTRFAAWLIAHLPASASQTQVDGLAGTINILGELGSGIRIDVNAQAAGLNACEAKVADLTKICQGSVRILEVHVEALAHLRTALQTREEQEQRERWLKRLSAMSAEQRAVLDRVTTTLELPAWPAARAAVRRCAMTLGFANPEMWVQYSRALKADAGQAQNVFRHIKAVHEVKDELARDGVTLPNPDLHLLIELAYHGYTTNPRGPL